MSVLIPILKKGNAKECSNYHTIALISHASKVLLKIPQARLWQYIELRTSRCTSWVSKRQRNQSLNFQHSLDHAASKGIKKKIYFISLTALKSLCGPQQTRKFLKKTGISDHLTCLLRSLYAGQEITEQNMEQWVQNWESSTTRLYIVTLLI